MAIATWSPDGKNAPVTLRASATTTGASTKNTDTAVLLGKGKYRVVTDVTVIETAGNDEGYTIVLEANTRAATSTWYEIGTIGHFGAAEVTGRAADDAADEYEIIVDNPYDYQVRVVTYKIGSTPTGITFSVKAYALSDKR